MSQVKKAFEKLEVGRIAGISQVLNSSLISNVVGKCEKSVFVAPSIYMESKGYLLSILGGESSHMNRKRYVKSTDTAFSNPVYIRFDKLGAISEAVRGKIMKLIESGLYQFWQNFIIHVHTVGGIGRKGEDEFVAQQLNSNILTVFVILVITTGLCGVTFLCEVGLWWKHLIFMWFRKGYEILYYFVVSGFIISVQKVRGTKWR